MVFRPFKGEIILGRISSASEFGMKSMFPILEWLGIVSLTATAVGLDFFDDIFVPPHLMFPGSFL